MTVLQIVAGTVSLAVTLVGVVLLVLAVRRYLQVFRLGAPAQRTDAPGTRTVTLLREFLGHTRMSRLPVVATAHWFTMISFGSSSSPSSPPSASWPTRPSRCRCSATGSLRVGDRALRVDRPGRHRRAHGRAPAPAPAQQPGEGGRRSRFFGSSAWQAYYVELTILGVTICILTLRGLEYALGRASASPSATAAHYPGTAWLGSSSAPARRGSRPRSSSSPR